MSLQLAIDAALREVDKQRRELSLSRSEKERQAYKHGVFVAEQIVAQLRSIQSMSRIQREFSH